MTGRGRFSAVDDYGDDYGSRLNLLVSSIVVVAVVVNQFFLFSADNNGTLESIMSEPRELDFWTHAGEILDRMRRGGVLCTVADKAGKKNLLTLGWGQIGPVYHGHPVFYEKIAPPHRLLTPEHRQQPLQKQHTLYFAEVLGAYRGYLDSGAVATPDVR